MDTPWGLGHVVEFVKSVPDEKFNRELPSICQPMRVAGFQSQVPHFCYGLSHSVHFFGCWYFILLTIHKVLFISPFVFKLFLFCGYVKDMTSRAHSLRNFSSSSFSIWCVENKGTLNIHKSRLAQQNVFLLLTPLKPKSGPVLV